jgi:subtilisin family serine protease
MYVGPPPVRHATVKGRRPVVATLDTGCGVHPWLSGVVRTDVTLGTDPIGYVDPATDPERWPDQVGALDGGIDALSGHGTFIAGLVHQACPDADIVAFRIVGSEGPIVESDLVKALKDVKEVARRHRDGESGGHPIDVLSLSLGYYHETPEDEQFDPTMSGILAELGTCGVTVVCSAGNDATDRPCFPAAWCPWPDPTQTIVPVEPGVVPIVAVGALNPNGTDALFSNVGPWVRAWAFGASVMSTLPPFQGGLQPAARTERDQRVRESIDPDDYTGRFALWSGTSFAAPLFAGRLAAQMLGSIDPAHDTRADAVARGWDAVAALTDLAP